MQELGCPRGHLGADGSRRFARDVPLEDPHAEKLSPFSAGAPQNVLETLRKAVGDTVAEERAWMAFGLVPMMLFNRLRGWGSIGKDELAI